MPDCGVITVESGLVYKKTDWHHSGQQLIGNGSVTAPSSVRTLVIY